MITYLPLNFSNWPRHKAAIMALEHMAFSEAQSHPASFYENILADTRQISFIALKDNTVVGFAFSGSLELFCRYPGVQQDPRHNTGTVLYAADMVVAPECRKQGIARVFKLQQMEAAKALGFEFIAGRNRLEYAHAMWCLNQSLGAVEIQRLTGIYKDGREPNEAIYYHIAL